MSKIVVFLAALLISFVAIAQQKQEPTKPEPAKPEASQPQAAPQEKLLVNPVKPTPESLAEGKKYFGYDCAMCHGDNGDGKGQVAMDENYTLKDFRDPATLHGKSDGEIFNILKKGKGHMPLERVRISQNELWNLVNYVRSLSQKSMQQ